MSKSRSQETGDRRQEEWGIERRQESELSLDFSANSQPFHPHFLSFLEGKPCTFSRLKKAQTFICQCF